MTNTPKTDPAAELERHFHLEPPSCECPNESKCLMLAQSSARAVLAELRQLRAEPKAPSLTPAVQTLVDAREAAQAKSAWIQTIGGKAWDLRNPRAEDVDINDIICALFRLNRFTGHTRRDYTVGEHSVRVARLAGGWDGNAFARPELALAGLLHDAPEAYLGDLSSPLRSLLPDYKRIYRAHELVILPALGISADLPHEVKHADLVLLATEKRDLLAPEPKPWLPLPDPMEESLERIQVNSASFITHWHMLKAIAETS